jgi:hypothetical protein
MCDVLRCGLVALLLTLLGCSSKPVVQQIPPPPPAPDVPSWVKEYSSLPNEWYCSFGASDSEAKEKMISLILANIKSENTGEVDQTIMQRVEEEIKKVAGTMFYAHPNGTVYAAIKKIDIVSHYSYKIKNFFDYANAEYEKAKADAARNDTKSALAKVSPIKGILENDFDSWALVLRMAGGDSSDSINIKKRDYLLMIDNLNRANAAKELAEKLRPRAASLEVFANAVINAKHPKLKGEAWQKTQAAWNEFMPLLSKIKNLNREKAALFEPVSALYARAREDYSDYCKTAKLYWNPEQSDIYSNIAFSKLSKNLKLEKAKCIGHGISLIYKNTGHECKNERCSHKASLLIVSCQGEEHRFLEENVEVIMDREIVALKKLPGELESKSFWNEWRQEVEKWKPICE